MEDIGRRLNGVWRVPLTLRYKGRTDILYAFADSLLFDLNFVGIVGHDEHE